MITTRERATPAEVVRGVSTKNHTNLIDRFRDVLPLDRRYCVFTNQGKAAFEQIVLAAGLQCSRILVPAFFPDDFVGIFLKYKMTPVFVDVDPDRYHLDLDAITTEHLAGARAMLVLHTFGLPADGVRYREFCDEHGLVMIEDCARSLGASTGGALVGSFGHYALFSLPKCTPVREGGIALSEKPMQTSLEGARIGIFGFLHALALIRFPFTSLLEAPAYAILADTPAYPREVGNYQPLPARELDGLGRLILDGFMPHYRAAIASKRACASKLRQGLEPCGFTFQADEGDHICTAVSVDPPADIDADILRAFLLRRHGVKASAMWRGSLGISAFAERIWNTRRERTPVAMRLATRLLQLPVSRFQTPRQTATIVAACKRFLSSSRSTALLDEAREYSIGQR
jgi:dTDP-4-amino-4,6-dideoxygalactose transaminase